MGGDFRDAVFDLGSDTGAFYRKRGGRTIREETEFSVGNLQADSSQVKVHGKFARRESRRDDRRYRT